MVVSSGRAEMNTRMPLPVGSSLLSTVVFRWKCTSDGTYSNIFGHLHFVARLRV